MRLNLLCCPPHPLTEEEINNLRIILLEFFSDSSKSLTELLDSGKVKEYVEMIGVDKLRDFLAGLCDPAGLVFFSGPTRARQYRTTRMGRSMLRVYKGEVELPNPDAEE